MGTSDLGLCKLVGDQLTVVKDNLHPKRMDARGALLTIDDKVVACTEDGERFRGWKLQHAAGLWRQNGPPAWVAR